MGFFFAVILLLAATPLGFVPLGFMRATTLHIPVIIGSIFLGPKRGAALGLFFGLTSLYINTTAPTVTSFVFSPAIPVPGLDKGSLLALLVVLLPRILTGVFPYYAFNLAKKIMPSKIGGASYLIAGVVGSLTNTIFVMHFIFIFFGAEWSTARGGTSAIYSVILSVIAVNGVPEAIVAGILVSAVGGALNAFLPEIKKPRQE